MNIESNYSGISIVIPSFNQGRFIEDTITSILDQNYPRLELIVIDGGSTDNTVEIIKKYSSSISYWVSEKDSGQSEAINKGLAKCTGEVFNWINSDDMLAPGSLKNIGDAFANNNIDVYAGYCDYFEENISNIVLPNERMGLKPSVEDSIIFNKINQPGTFYRTAVIRQLGNISTDLHYAMDLELWLKYLLFYGKDKVFLSDQKTAFFRLHGNSKTISESEKFAHDREIIDLRMAVACKAPQFLVEKMLKRNSIIPGKNQWPLIETGVNNGYILAHIFKNYPAFFYEDYEYKNARKSFNFVFLHHLNLFNKKAIILFLKLFFIPTFIFNKLRKWNR